MRCLAGGFKAEVNLDLGIGWVGGAVIVDFVVGEEGAFAAQISRRDGPDVFPGDLDDFDDGAGFAGEDGVVAGGDGDVGHAGGDVFYGGDGAAEQVVVVAVFVAGVIGVDGED